MAIQTECGDCGRQLKVKDDAGGRRIKCPDCGSPVTIPGGGTGRSRPAKRRKEAAPRKEPEFDEDADVDFGALASMADRSMSLGSGDLEPCPGCGEEVGARATECPFCGEMIQDVKAKRKRKSKAKARDSEAAQHLGDDDDEGGVMGYVIFFMVFVVGNVILFYTTGWVIIPRR